MKLRWNRLWWLALLAGGKLFAAPGLARFEPATGCYLGAFIEHDSLARGDFAAFERIVGKRHACYINYAGYGRPFPSLWVERVAAHGGAAHLALEPNGGLDHVKDDSYLRGWAQAAAASGIPIFLRFASEMNGNWMAYCGNPQLYVDKWRLVFRVMREEAPNVAMVWCPFSSPRDNITRYYPGDDAVDWVGVNIYSVAYHNGDIGQPAAAEDPREELLRSVYEPFADRKPIMICEYAATNRCRVVGGQTTRFAIDKMTALYEALPRRFPRVKCVQWFSWDAFSSQAANNDYSLTSNPEITAVYRRLVASSHFLSSVELSPNPKPGGNLAPLLPPVVPHPLERQRTPATGGYKPPVRSQPLPTPPAPEDDPAWLRPIRAEFGWLGVRPGQTVMDTLKLSVYHPADWQVTLATALLNGKVVYATNRAPFTWSFDPSELEPARYDLQVQLTRADGTTVTSPPLPVEVRRPQ